MFNILILIFTLMSVEVEVGSVNVFCYSDISLTERIALICLDYCFAILFCLPGFKRLDQNLELMIGRKVPIFFKVCIAFVTPLALLVRS